MKNSASLLYRGACRLWHTPESQLLVPGVCLSLLPWVMFLGLGLAYTVFSEHVNVHLAHQWAYSRWVPTYGGIGLVPLMQWLVVPTLSVRLVRRP